MSNAFTDFLGGVGSGLFGNTAQLRDYQHASRMYVTDTYARAPKVGFLYFVQFNINKAALLDTTWSKSNKGIDIVGLLVKSVDLPKFNIATEILNQYNRKTVVQTKLSYGNVNMSFHDDNSDISTNLWKNYYKFYYTDGRYGDNKTHPVQFTDTKFGETDYRYGFRTDNTNNEPFFKSIDIYVLHQHKFTQMTLVNPTVVAWEHDTLSQEEGSKMLSNKMTLAYEDVIYNQGKIKKNESPGAFATAFYDKTPSPLSIGGLGTNTLFGAGGVIAGAGGVLGAFADAQSPLDLLGAAIQAKTLAKNVRSLTKAGIQQEGYSILGGVLGNISQTGVQPGGLTQQISQGFNQSGYGVSARVGVNLFSNKNTSVNSTTKATPRKITGGG
jgi:hypothetical protein